MILSFLTAEYAASSLQSYFFCKHCISTHFTLFLGLMVFPLMSLKAISVHLITKKSLGWVSFSWEWCHTPYFPLVGSVGLLNHVWLFMTPWTAARQASLSPTPEAQSDSCPSSWWCHPTMSSSVVPPPPAFPHIRVFSNESVLRIRWPKFWSFCFSISPSNEYSGLTSFRIDWFALLAVQETLKSLL